MDTIMKYVRARVRERAGSGHRVSIVRDDGGIAIISPQTPRGRLCSTITAVHLDGLDPKRNPIRDPRMLAVIESILRSYAESWDAKDEAA